MNCGKYVLAGDTKNGWACWLFRNIREERSCVCSMSIDLLEALQDRGIPIPSCAAVASG